MKSSIPCVDIRTTIVNNAAGRLTDSDQKLMIEGDTFLWMKSGPILGGKHIAANLIMVSAK